MVMSYLRCGGGSFWSGKKHAKTSLDLEMQSGDGSGSNELLVESGSGEQWEDDWQKLGVFTADGSVQVEKDSSLEGSGLEGSSMEGSSSEVDYTDFVYPQSMTLPQNSLNHELQQQEDNMIL
ncbi:hypothetical protein JZ751_011031 [Albula glossodonta]|uniref:Uncharacterized protein n=1 Tax=Albula glossodonta TaxID=121402 RepID=A0A8T2P404_9TELE|nr:hypothetical protein JZ751_011031 [Albula glossodonta]